MDRDDTTSHPPPAAKTNPRTASTRLPTAPIPDETRPDFARDQRTLPDDGTEPDFAGARGSCRKTAGPDFARGERDSDTARRGRPDFAPTS